VMVPVIGVMLGASFTPDIVGRMPGWWPSLAMVPVFVMASTALIYPLYRGVFSYDRATAFFSAVPGGLLEMSVLAEEQKGDTRTVSAIHFLRIVFAVLSLPLAFGIIFGPVGSAAGVSVKPAGAGLIGWGDGALLVMAAIAGYWAAKLIKLPAAAISGPVLFSAIIHGAGWTDAAPPDWLVIAAQVVMGSSLGARFAGFDRRQLLRAFRAAMSAGLVMMAFAVLAALAISALLEKPFVEMVLALAPGGLTEMALIALSLQIGIALVTTHHLMRIMASVILMPLIFRLMQKRAPADV
jgi:membrane AbrB-like protein